MPNAEQEFVEPSNNLTPRAQQALALAREEAERFHHNFVGTEHLLLGLIRLGQGVAVAVASVDLPDWRGPCRYTTGVSLNAARS